MPASRRSYTLCLLCLLGLLVALPFVVSLLYEEQPPPPGTPRHAVRPSAPPHHRLALPRLVPPSPAVSSSTSPTSPATERRVAASQPPTTASVLLSPADEQRTPSPSALSSRQRVDNAGSLAPIIADASSVNGRACMRERPTFCSLWRTLDAFDRRRVVQYTGRLLYDNRAAVDHRFDAPDAATTAATLRAAFVAQTQTRVHERSPPSLLDLDALCAESNVQRVHERVRAALSANGNGHSDASFAYTLDLDVPPIELDAQPLLVAERSYVFQNWCVLNYRERIASIWQAYGGGRWKVRAGSFAPSIYGDFSCRAGLFLPRRHRTFARFAKNSTAGRRQRNGDVLGYDVHDADAPDVAQPAFALMGGDVDFAFRFPMFTKSTPVLVPRAGDAYSHRPAHIAPWQRGNVLLRALNKHRHWGAHSQLSEARALSASIAFATKRPSVAWRGGGTGELWCTVDDVRACTGRTLTAERVQDWRQLPAHLGWQPDALDRPSRLQLAARWAKRRSGRSPSAHVDVALLGKHAAKLSADVAPASRLSVEQLLHYRYLLAVEGNDVSSGLKWMLLSNSVVLMPAPLVDSWLLESSLVPFVHYVPVDRAFENVSEAVDACEQRTDRCESIAIAATAHIERFLDDAREERVEHAVIAAYFERVAVRNYTTNAHVWRASGPLRRSERVALSTRREKKRR